MTAGAGPGRPLVVAHRGASADAPEHTLAAYELALTSGADGVECDVRLSRDGHLVCVHDRRVDRTSSGRGVVSGMTLQGLAELDYGGWHDPFPDTADALVAEPGVHETPLLTLTDLLELVCSHGGGATLFLETKHPVRYGGLVEAKVLAELHRFGLARPRPGAGAAVVVMSFSPSAVWRVRRSAPHLPTVLLGRRGSTLASVRAGGAVATAVGPSVTELREDPGLVARARAQGRATYTWTVDTEADAELCASLGVRWVATNRPATLRGWWSASG